MRKLLSVVLAVAMVCALAITANAADATLRADSTTATTNVIGTYVEGARAATVYSVDVDWGDMNFVYTDMSEGVWNPDTHTYENQTAAAWTGSTENTGKVTVTNHSNAAVSVSFAYTPAEGSTVTAAFDKASTDLDAAVVNEPNNAPKATVTLSITGGAISANGTIGSVTVTLDATEVPTTRTVTFTNDPEVSVANESGDVYLYAWNGTTGDENGGFPGEKMTKGEGNVYTYELDVDTYDHIIIGNGLTGEQEGHKQSADLDLATLNGNYNLKMTYDGDSGVYTLVVND